MFLSVSKFSGGNTLLIRLGMHCFEKKSMKSFAFSLQFKINVLFTRIGGILGALHLFITINNLPIGLLGSARVIHFVSQVL